MRPSTHPLRTGSAFSGPDPTSLPSRKPCGDREPPPWRCTYDALLSLISRWVANYPDVEVSSIMSAPKPCSSCQSVFLNRMSKGSIVTKQSTTVFKLTGLEISSMVAVDWGCQRPCVAIGLVLRQPPLCEDPTVKAGYTSAPSTRFLAQVCQDSLRTAQMADSGAQRRAANGGRFVSVLHRTAQKNLDAEPCTLMFPNEASKSQ